MNTGSIGIPAGRTVHAPAYADRDAGLPSDYE